MNATECQLHHIPSKNILQLSPQVLHWRPRHTSGNSRNEGRWNNNWLCGCAMTFLTPNQFSATALKAKLFESNHTSIIITRQDEQSALMHTRWCGCWYPCSECQVQVYQATSAPAVNPNVTNWLHSAPCCHYYRHLTTNQSLYAVQAVRSQSQW